MIDLPYDIEYVDWETNSLAAEHIASSDISVFDTYQIDNSQLACLSSKSKLPVSITDAMLRYIQNGIVVVGSIYGDSIQLPTEIANYILKGPQYMLFRNEFWSLPNYLVKNKIENITISLGGFVDKQKIAPLLEIVHNVFPDANVSVFGQAESRERIDAHEKVSFKNLVSSENYIKHLYSTDLMITNGGQTLNESILIGIPVIAISTADNQIKNAQKWRELGVIKYCGKTVDKNFNKEFKEELIEFISKDERIKFNRVSQESIDSNGAKRVVDFVLEKYKSI